MNQAVSSIMTLFVEGTLVLYILCMPKFVTPLITVLEKKRVGFISCSSQKWMSVQNQCYSKCYKN